jgi:hypothetical protein
VAEPPRTAEYLKIDWGVEVSSIFLASIISTRGRHLLAARPKTLEGPLTGGALVGSNLRRSYNRRARTGSADSCAMASISRTNYHAALGRSLVAVAGPSSLKRLGDRFKSNDPIIDTDGTGNKHLSISVSWRAFCPRLSRPRPSAPRSRCGMCRSMLKTQGQRLDKVLGQAADRACRAAAFSA